MRHGFGGAPGRKLGRRLVLQLNPYPGAQPLSSFISEVSTQWTIPIRKIRSTRRTRRVPDSWILLPKLRDDNLAVIGRNASPCSPTSLDSNQELSRLNA